MLLRAWARRVGFTGLHDFQDLQFFCGVSLYSLIRHRSLLQRDHMVVGLVNLVKESLHLLVGPYRE